MMIADSYVIASGRTSARIYDPISYSNVPEILSPIHSGKANVLYNDGHVSSQRYKDVVNDPLFWNH